MDGSSGLTVLNLLQLQASYKSTVLMHEDQPRGAMRLKKEEQVDLGLHRD